MNKYQQRIKIRNQGGRYQFYGIPNNDEGKFFVSLIKKYINKDVFKISKRFRGAKNWVHSINESDSDSFVIYLNQKTK